MLPERSGCFRWFWCFGASNSRVRSSALGFRLSPRFEGLVYTVGVPRAQLRNAISDTEPLRWLMNDHDPRSSPPFLNLEPPNMQKKLGNASVAFFEPLLLDGRKASAQKNLQDCGL